MAYSPDGRRIVSKGYDDSIRVWDADSEECLQVIHSSEDFTSIEVGENRFPWRALNRILETVIEPEGGGESVAWFPAALYATQFSNRTWTARVDNYLYLIRLEGEPDSKPPGGAS